MFLYILNIYIFNYFKIKISIFTFAFQNDLIYIPSYKNIIEFFDDNDNLIGFVNYVENHYLDYTKSFIKMIYFTDKTFLDLMIKQMIKQLKQKKYSYALLNSESKSFDKNTIDILKSNDFAGDDFLFLNL